MNTFTLGKLLAYKCGYELFSKMRHAGAGYKTAGGVFAALMGYTYLKGPHVENEVYRCGLAGIASTLFVELAIQPIDTLNMKAKVDKKFGIMNFVRRKGVGSLMRGIQPVLHGMAISSFIYFILYKKFKDSVKLKMDAYNIDKTSLAAVFIMSAGASTLANLCAIGLYYPFDLVKTRMQIVGEYNYKNILDAFYKIGQEGNSTYKFQNYFKGFGLYSLTFITFTTLEFSIYETIMMYLAGKQKVKTDSALGATLIDSSGKASEGIFEHKKDKQISHILISSAIAGAIGGFLTNPLEFLAVNKQADPKMKVMNVFKTTSMYDIFFKGGMFRTAYYSTQAVLIFFLLEKFGSHLKCEL